MDCPPPDASDPLLLRIVRVLGTRATRQANKRATSPTPAAATTKPPIVAGAAKGGKTLAPAAVVRQWAVGDKVKEPEPLDPGWQGVGLLGLCLLCACWIDICVFAAVA